MPHKPENCCICGCKKGDLIGNLLAWGVGVGLRCRLTQPTADNLETGFLGKTRFLALYHNLETGFLGKNPVSGAVSIST